MKSLEIMEKAKQKIQERNKEIEENVSFLDLREKIRYFGEPEKIRYFIADKNSYKDTPDITGNSAITLTTQQGKYLIPEIKSYSDKITEVAFLEAGKNPELEENWKRKDVYSIARDDEELRNLFLTVDTKINTPEKVAYKEYVAASNKDTKKIEWLQLRLSTLNSHDRKIEILEKATEISIPENLKSEIEVVTMLEDDIHYDLAVFATNGNFEQLQVALERKKEIIKYQLERDRDNSSFDAKDVYQNVLDNSEAYFTLNDTLISFEQTYIVPEDQKALYFKKYLEERAKFTHIENIERRTGDDLRVIKETRVLNMLDNYPDEENTKKLKEYINNGFMPEKLFNKIYTYFNWSEIDESVIESNPIALKEYVSEAEKIYAWLGNNNEQENVNKKQFSRT